MARAPEPGRCRRALEPVLGPEGCARLETVLIRRAVEWALSVGDAFVAATGDASLVAPLLPDGVALLDHGGAEVAGAVLGALGEVHDRRGGPVLIAATGLPSLGSFHARAALADLADGADMAVGPALDGGYYLLAVPGPTPALTALPGDRWTSSSMFQDTLELAAEHGLEVGMLRPERTLSRPEDVAAALADPLTPPDVRAVLQPA